MRVAVLGGGLQGCCIALLLAERDAEVTLYDNNDRLLSQAAIANEGKIHLGFMYAADPSLATARMMMRGALAFVPFFEARLGGDQTWMTHSDPAVYLVHRNSQRSVDDVSRYMAAVHAELAEVAVGCQRASYFGLDLRAPPRPWNATERESKFDGCQVQAAFSTPEVAIKPMLLADRIRAAIAATPAIEVRLGHTVRRLKESDGIIVVDSTQAAGAEDDRYDHVVNALWNGRLAVDATLGLRPGRQWIYRFKYGVRCRRPDGVDLPSATVISGPFGEVVNYPDGLVYLTWYPACAVASSLDIVPPVLPNIATEPVRSRIVDGTFAGLADIVPALRTTGLDRFTDLSVAGGIIVAWGETDIDDPTSELHHRFDIGVSSRGRFHSVDPGKLTMAPHFAGVCADRIIPVD
jgi:glycine/D-amino acid oxidase-like deaminating enzyme